MKVLTISNIGQRLLVEATLSQIIKVATEVRDNGYMGMPPAVVEIQEALDCYKAVTLAVDADDGAAVFTGLPHEPGALDGLREVGINPDRELGPHEARALRPRCTHGKYFTEDCNLCAESAERTPVRACQHGRLLTEDCQGCRDDHAAMIDKAAPATDDGPAS